MIQAARISKALSHPIASPNLERLFALQFLPQFWMWFGCRDFHIALAARLYETASFATSLQRRAARQRKAFMGSSERIFIRAVRTRSLHVNVLMSEFPLNLEKKTPVQTCRVEPTKDMHLTHMARHSVKVAIKIHAVC